MTGSKTLSLIYSAAFLMLFSGCTSSGRIKDADIIVDDIDAAASGMDVKADPYSDLSIPTEITKIEDTYFIVDCYHDQVLYSDDIKKPLNEWYVMTDEMSRGHTVAGNGRVYLIDDTENERIMVFQRAGDRFVFSQVLSEVTGRPHYIVYDDASATFYAWCSVSGQMYLIRSDEKEHVYVSEIRSIPELDGVYVRSFTILDGDILFVSGNSSILRADLKSFKVKERYPVPDTMAGMVQITRIEGKYYITVSTDNNWDQTYATIIRCDRLEDLADGRYEDIYDSFIGGGTPYYITCFDDAWYMTEHRIPGHSIWRFTVSGDDITAETLF